MDMCVRSVLEENKKKKKKTKKRFIIMTETETESRLLYKHGTCRTHTEHTCLIGSSAITLCKIDVAPSAAAARLANSPPAPTSIAAAAAPRAPPPPERAESKPILLTGATPPRKSVVSLSPPVASLVVNAMHDHTCKVKGKVEAEDGEGVCSNSIYL